MTVASQVRCPSCNGAQEPQPDEHYSCAFCLQPFTVTDARREENRLLDEVKRWMLERVGAAAGSETVDASSRAFIFGQKILPELRRELDRSIEKLGSYAQHPLVIPPIPLPLGTGGPNPLVSQRAEVLAFKSLRARLGSEQVISFAVRDNDRALVKNMDGRLRRLSQYSNLLEAGALATDAGFAAATRNLDELISESGAILESTTGAEAAFHDAQKARLEALRELTLACAEVVGASSLSGESLAARLDDVRARLQTAANAIEASGHDPAEAMPLVLGVGSEATACAHLAGWLRAFDVIAGHSGCSFQLFVQEVSAVMSSLPQDRGLEFLEVLTQTYQAARGERAVPAVTDFSWVTGWAERSRTKKTFGLFGNEEQLASREELFVPVWFAEVSYSRDAGRFLSSGVEQKMFAIVDACAPHPGKVVFLADRTHPTVQALEAPQAIGGYDVALPLSCRGLVQPIIEAAGRARPGLHNVKVQSLELGFVAGSVARLESPKGARDLTACLDGALPVDDAVRVRVAARRQLALHFK